MTVSRASLRTWALSAVAQVTRRFHPRGTQRLLRLLHHPDHRTWAIETIASLADSSLRLHVSTANFLEWQVFFLGTYEPEVQAVLRRSIGPGRHAIDVGANIGIHTLVMAQAVKSGSVIACEPSPELCARLRANLALNHTTNVRVRQVAVSSQSGTVMLYPNAAAAATRAPNLTSQRTVPDAAPAIRVPGVTLDELVAAEGLIGIDAVKIDIDGLEAAVLAGARGLLSRDHPTLMFEYTSAAWSQAGYTLGGVLADLQSLRYTLFRKITPGGLRPLPEPAPPFMNILAACQV